MDEWMNRIEAKLDRLISDKYFTDEAQVRRLLTAYKCGRKIEAIKEVRAMCGIGLKEAKDLVESVE